MKYYNDKYYGNKPTYEGPINNTTSTDPEFLKKIYIDYGNIATSEGPITDRGTSRSARSEEDLKKWRERSEAARIKRKAYICTDIQSLGCYLESNQKNFPFLKLHFMKYYNDQHYGNKPTSEGPITDRGTPLSEAERIRRQNDHKLMSETPILRKELKEALFPNNEVIERMHEERRQKRISVRISKAWAAIWKAIREFFFPHNLFMNTEYKPTPEGVITTNTTTIPFATLFPQAAKKELEAGPMDSVTQNWLLTKELEASSKPNEVASVLKKFKHNDILWSESLRMYGLMSVYEDKDSYVFRSVNIGHWNKVSPTPDDWHLAEHLMRDFKREANLLEDWKFVARPHRLDLIVEDMIRVMWKTIDWRQLNLEMEKLSSALEDAKKATKDTFFATSEILLSDTRDRVFRYNERIMDIQYPEIYAVKRYIYELQLKQEYEKFLNGDYSTAPLLLGRTEVHRPDEGICLFCDIGHRKCFSFEDHEGEIICICAPCISAINTQLNSDPPQSPTV